MARTYRRGGCRYDYRWVLRDWERWSQHPGAEIRHDPHSAVGHKALARYHSDATATTRKSAPRWYRKVHDASIRMHNRQVLHRWLIKQDFDPVFIDWYRHNANWSWWLSAIHLIRTVMSFLPRQAGAIGPRPARSYGEIL